MIENEEKGQKAKEMTESKKKAKNIKFEALKFSNKG